jgi:hypothetical protein
MLVQSQPHGGGDLERTAIAAAGRETLHGTDRPLQAAEQPPALRAAADVARHPRPPRATQLAVEEFGHVGGRPPMIAPEARPL